MDPKQMKRYMETLGMLNGKMPMKKKRYVPDDEFEKMKMAKMKMAKMKDMDEEGMMEGKRIQGQLTDNPADDEEMAMRDEEKQEMMDDPEGEMGESMEDEESEPHVGSLFNRGDDQKKNGVRIMIALGMGKKKGMMHR